MRTQILTSFFVALAMTGSANALLGIDFGNVLDGLGGLLNGMLNLDLLQNGQLITLGLNADLITSECESNLDNLGVAFVQSADVPLPSVLSLACSEGASTVLVSVQVPGILGACACVNNDLLGTILGVTRNACDAQGAVSSPLEIFFCPSMQSLTP